jgi:hypothetical protein
MNNAMRNTITLFTALALVACGGEAEAPVATPPATGTAPPTAPAAPTNPTSITLGAPAVTVTSVAAPRWTFVVATAGEYQFDATGMPQDAQLSILNSDGWTSASDGDSGPGLDARVAAFLAPGTYTIRVNEYNHAAAAITVAATALTAMTPAATIAPGAPPTTVTTPAGDWDRAASSEVAITIETPGSYRLSAAATDTTLCTPYITLIQNNAVLTSNSYGGPNNSAQIDQQLTAGTYTLRLRDSSYRACTQTVTVAPTP